MATSLRQALTTLWGRYAAALRDEPKLRSFFLLTLIDDVGTAVSTWAGTVFVSSLVRTPEDLAGFVVPMLWARLLGGAFAGPLADLGARRGSEALRRWRYKVVVWRYLVQFAALTAVVALMARGAVTLPRMVAYFVLQQLVSALGAPTQSAFFVDLLRVTRPQLDAAGQPELDETGEPLRYRVHLLTGSSMLEQVSALAAVLGLLGGGWLLHTLARGKEWPLLAFDALTFLLFALGSALLLHPTREPREFTLRQLGPEPERDVQGGPWHRLVVRLTRAAAAQTVGSARALGRFVREPENRPFAHLLALLWCVQLLGRAYDSRLILTGVLHLSMESYRRFQLACTVVTIAMYSVVVSLAGRVRSLGSMLAVAVLLDGVAMACAGLAAGRGWTPGAALAMGADAAMTVLLLALAGLAQKSVSSPALRGRILGATLLVTVLLQLVGQRLYPPLTHRFGQASVLAGAGLAQVLFVVFLLAFPGRGPAAFRLRVADA